MVSTDGLVAIFASVRRRGAWRELMVFVTPERCLEAARAMRAMLGPCWLTLSARVDARSHFVWRFEDCITKRRRRR